MLYHKRAIELTAGLPRLNRNILKGLVAEVFSRAYLDLIGLLRYKLEMIGTPNVPIVIHGYDYAIPDGRGWGGGLGPLPGPWLDPSLSRKGYDRKDDAAVRRVIVQELIDAFNEMLAAVAANPPTRTTWICAARSPIRNGRTSSIPRRPGFWR